MGILRTLLEPVGDLIFTAECFHCQAPLADGEQRLCAACWAALTPVRETDRTFRIMTERFRADGEIDGLLSLFYFEKGKALQTLAHALKYQEVGSFGTELGRRLGAAALERGVTADLIVPVPLNRRKERERGYNQSDLLAGGMSAVTGVPFDPRAVRRVRYTVTQTALTAEQRRENIADAFEVRPRRRGALRGAHVIVVDDVITTGSTVREIARMLKQAGAARITAASAGLAMLEGEGPAVDIEER